MVAVCWISRLILFHALSWQNKELKSKPQNPVKKGMQVLANDTKERLKKFQQELLTEKLKKNNFTKTCKN